MLTPASPELKAVESALHRYEAAVAENERLLSLQAELAAKTAEAVRSGDPEDADFVQRIAMDRTRLEMLPAKLAQAESAVRAAMVDLYEAMKPASRVLGQANADAHTAAKAKLESTLRELLTNEGVILIMVDTGFQFAKSVQRPAQLAGTFSPMSLYEVQNDGPALASLARHLLSVVSPACQPATV